MTGILSNKAANLNIAFVSASAAYIDDTKQEEPLGDAVPDKFSGFNIHKVTKVPFFKTYNKGRTQDVAGYITTVEYNDGRKERLAAFRGTWTLMDAYRDIKSAIFGTITIHGQTVYAGRGFVIDEESSTESFTQTLQQLEDKDTEPVPLTFTGHSLGGATAQLAALRYASRGKTFSNNIQSVFTFGAPRTYAGGDSVRTYNNNLGAKTLHVVCEGDPVSRIPPALFGFERTGFITEIKLNTLEPNQQKQNAYKSISDAFIRAIRIDQHLFWALNRVGETTTSMFGVDVGKHFQVSYERVVEQMVDDKALIESRAAIKNSSSIWVDVRQYVTDLTREFKQQFWSRLIDASQNSNVSDNVQKIEIAHEENTPLSVNIQHNIDITRRFKQQLHENGKKEDAAIDEKKDNPFTSGM